VAYPLAGRDELVKLMPAIRGKYPSFASFGASRLEEIFSIRPRSQGRGA
jgi:enediyne biosynthesis protein E4